MRVAALYDIHGNLPALRAVLAEAAREGAETFVIGGDVADGPMPFETIEQLVTLGDRARYVRGNTDRAVVEAYDQGRTDQREDGDPAARAVWFAAGAISRTQRDFLGGFAPTVGLRIDGLGPVLFCHGSPRSDEEIITRVTPEERLRSILEGNEEPVIVGGHIHQQYDRSLPGQRVVNPGSVGMPYEGRPGAYWALLGPGIEMRRTEYDLDELRRSGFSDLDKLLRESLFEPADPGFVAEHFEGQADDSWRDPASPDSL
jgi:predicted phosphodiesterase